MSTELDTTGLTAEEIAALSEPDTPEELTATQGELQDKGATGATTTEEEDDDQGGEDKGGTDAGAAGAEGDAAAVAPASEPAAAATEPAAAPSTAQSAPLLVAEAPADAEEKLKAIAADKAELRRKYDDGEITFDEYEDQKDGYVKQEREIERAIDKANIAAAMEAQRLQNQWDADCKTFLDSNKDLYTGDANKERFEELNETIKLLAQQPRNAGLSGPQLLAKAHTVTLAARGETVPQQKTDTKADTKPTKQPIPKAILPPDLGAMPAASGNDPTEGKWASLDRLRDSGNGVAYEAALSKMSQADRDAYLAA